VEPDLDLGSRPKRPHLITRPQVVDRAIALLDREGTNGLSMRKLAGALGVSLPTVYAAVASRKQLVQDILRLTVAQEVASVGDEVGPGSIDPVVVLGRFVDAATRRSWLPDLAQELDTRSLLQVLDEAAGVGSPNVVDRLTDEIGSEVGAAPLPSGQLLFLVMLLLDDVNRLVESGHCDLSEQGALAHQMLRTVLVSAERATPVATG
jgi:AcrR family transcriptional regulator